MLIQQLKVTKGKKTSFYFSLLGLSMSVFAAFPVSFFTSTTAAQAQSLDNPTTTEQNSNATIIASFWGDIGDTVNNTLRTGVGIGAGLLQQRLMPVPQPQPAPYFQQPAPQPQPAPYFQQPAPQPQPAPYFQQPAPQPQPAPLSGAEKS